MVVIVVQSTKMAMERRGVIGTESSLRVLQQSDAQGSGVGEGKQTMRIGQKWREVVIGHM